MPIRMRTGILQDTDGRWIAFIELAGNAYGIGDPVDTEEEAEAVSRDAGQRMRAHLLAQGGHFIDINTGESQ